MLNEILKAKKRELAAARERRPLDEIRAKAKDLPPSRDFLAAVAPSVHGGMPPQGGVRRTVAPPAAVNVSLIAEIKRASPSRGVLNARLDPVALAKIFAAAGASALSVLTDRAFFRGSPDDLRAARAVAGLPVLRKDFLIDPYQVWEARAMEADAILLIARILSRQQLQDLGGLAQEIGLAALFEVHRDDELPAVLDCRPRLVGVNARDLDTFAISPDICERLGRTLPPDVGRVAESGISSREDVVRLATCGYNAVLVGEALVRSADAGAKVKELLGVKTTGPPPFNTATAADLKTLPPLDEALRGTAPESS